MSKSEKKLTVSVFIIRMISLSIACFLLLGLAVYTIRLDSVTSVLSKSGSRGEEVRQIQQKLKNWGYYTGSVDGIFGVQTKKAVVAFQKKNGLNPDGIVGPATLKALGIYNSQQTGGNGGYSSSDVALLANISRSKVRLRLGRWCSTGWSILPFRIRFPAWSTSQALLRRLPTGRSTRL